jgi:SAM-dependent methyltransferase
MMSEKHEIQKKQVREGYEGVLQRAQQRTAESTTTAASLSRTTSIGYSADDVKDLPDTATGASFGCGNPLAFAGVAPGETVVDIGSGAGMDCLVAAKAVGETGRVIGVDMTPDMIAAAAANAAKANAGNVEFRLGDADNLPVDDGSVDWVISNCVINLTPDKGRVFDEIARVLKPGGRISISDIVTDGPLPQAIVDNFDALIGCVAGAVEEKTYLAELSRSGFVDVAVTDRVTLDPGALVDDSDCGCDCGCGPGDGATERVATTATASPSVKTIVAEHGDLLRDRVRSVRVTARKPE